MLLNIKLISNCWNYRFSVQKRLFQFLICFSFLRPALAAVIPFPESTSQQFHTFGLFQDSECMFVRTNHSENWLDLAADIPLIGFSDSSKSQVIMTSSYFANVTGNRLTQTIDYRMMLSYDTELSSAVLMRIGYNHSSGHANDDIVDKSLLGLNLDEDNLILRLIYTGNRKFRFGFTLLPVLSADPKRQWFSSNQFFEFLPAEQKVDKSANFFVAGGIEEYGMSHPEASLHFQTGFYFGNHVLPMHATTARLALGAYGGPHPALKQFAFRELRQSFVYAGLIVDL